MRWNLLIQQPPKGAPPQHRVSALSSHASSSRTPPGRPRVFPQAEKTTLILGEEQPLGLARRTSLVLCSAAWADPSIPLGCGCVA